CASSTLGHSFGMATGGTGAEGISNVMDDGRGRYRRTAKSSPPPLMSKAVVNSMNSLPRLSTPRTNTGKASGSLCHERCSEYSDTVVTRRSSFSLYCILASKQPNQVRDV